MGFRFRKSVKAGPIRINFSKSGIGWSIGGKGYRYTKKANGGTRQTFSIPGTGLSYVNETNKRNSKSNSIKKNTTPKSVNSYPEPAGEKESLLILPNKNEALKEYPDLIENLNKTLLYDIICNIALVISAFLSFINPFL